MKFIDLNYLELQAVSHNPAIRKQVLLTKGEVPHLTNLSQARFSPGQVAHLHSHQDMWEVFWVVEGEGIIVVNGETYPLTLGRCILVEPGDSHEITNQGQGYLTLLYFGIVNE